MGARHVPPDLSSAPCAPRPHKSKMSNTFLVRRDASARRDPRGTEKREALMDVGVLEVGGHTLSETLMTPEFIEENLKTSIKLKINSSKD